MLPALTSLRFIGDNEYLEDILSRIDAPLLNCIEIEPFNEVVFDARQLRHFISRTEAFKEAHRAVVESYGSSMVFVVLSRRVTADHIDHKLLGSRTSPKQWYWRVSSFAQFCSSALPPLPTLESLEIRQGGEHWQGSMGHTEWLEFLRPFTSVKNLVLSREAARYLAPALQELNLKNVTGILPALETLSLKASARSGPTQEAIAQFVATRQLSGRPVAVLYDD